MTSTQIITDDIANAILSAERHASALQEIRDNSRGRGDFADVRRIDLERAKTYESLAALYLRASKRARDAGDQEFARAHAKAYGNAERLAAVLFENAEV